MISHDRAIRSSVYSLVFSVSRALTMVGLFAMGFDLATVLWGVIGVGAAVVVVGCIDMARMCPGRWQFDGRLLLDQFHYVWPLWAVTIAGILGVQFDKFLISYNFDPETLAIYTRGAMELPMVGMITVTLGTAIMPELVTMASQGRMMESLDLWQEATRKSSLVIFPCFAFFLVIAPNFMVLMYTEAFRNAAWPFGVFLCLLPLRVAIYGALFRAIGQTKPIAISAVAGLLANIVIGSTLAYIGGKGTIETYTKGRNFISFIGPSIGTVASTFLIGGYLIWQLGKLSGVPIRKVMRWKELGRILALSVACGLFVAFVPLPHMPLLAKTVTQGVLFLVAFALLLWWMGALKGDERQLLLLPVRLFNRLRGRTQPPEQPPAPDRDGKGGNDAPK
jgi:peptidoglycan biosynthesis protein MviN/MurJ (putative lipid II flippase)